ncbi:MAG: hypothetical protein QOG90_1786 [Actinomycetota bacterium]|jgi:SAM-dependent methyltransferase
MGVVIALFAATGIGPGTDLLDVACGSGNFIRLARDAGATASGLDAAEGLVEIARDRNPRADIRLGSMFELPWEQESFDVVVSINGIWGHCGDALVEMRRVIRPGGMVGISFWGEGPPLDSRPFFKALLPHMPPTNVEGMRDTNAIATPGVAEKMLEAAGFDVVERGGRVSTIEWPDEETAWRAIASCGPIVPALEHSDPALVRRDVLAVMANYRDRHGIYRFRNDHQFVIARAA